MFTLNCNDMIHIDLSLSEIVSKCFIVAVRVTFSGSNFQILVR